MTARLVRRLVEYYDMVVALSGPDPSSSSSPPGSAEGPEPQFSIGPYMTLLFAATIAFTVSNLYAGPPTSIGELNCTGKGCILAIVAGVVGIVLLIVAGVGIYRGLVRAEYIQPRRSLSPPQFGSTREDMMILSLARERLASAPRRRWRRPVEAIYWQDYQAWNWYWFTRGRMRPEGIVLSSDLRGKMDEDDWKNLLSYYFPGKWRLPLRIILWLVFSIALPAFTLGIATFTLQLAFGFSSAYFVARALGPFLTLLTIVLLPRNARRGFLKEDRSKATAVGVQPLLDLFMKIDHLGLTSVQRGKKRRGLLAYLWPMPSITERIENLRRFTSEQAPKSRTQP